MTDETKEPVRLLGTDELEDGLFCCRHPENRDRLLAIAAWANDARDWLADHHAGHQNECEDPECDIGALLRRVRAPEGD